MVVKQPGFDYLSHRLRRIVRSLIEKERRENCYTWISFLKSKQHHVIIKLLRIITLAVCVTIFLFQVNDRVSYYLSYPVSTDVYIINNRDEIYPDMTICHNPEKGSRKLFQELGLPAWTCNSAVAYYMVNIKRKVSLEEMWNRLKSEEDIVSAKTVGLENSEPKKLTHSNIFLPYGICATFHGSNSTPGRNNQGKMEILFSENPKCTKNNIEYLYVHEANEHPMSRFEHEPLAAYRNHVKLSVRKYKFQNRKGHPCISSNEYAKCRHECFTNFSLRNGDCRFPFQPNETNLPSCGNGNVRQLWAKIQRFLRGQILDNCACTRKCSHRIFDSKIEFTESFFNKTVFILEFSDSHITYIRERFAYTAVNLLVDIGGNSGLWIGLSLLSIFNFLPRQRKSKSGQHSFAQKDPLFRIVLKRIRKDRVNLHYRELIKYTSQSSKILKLVFTSSVCILFACAVLNRINTFLHYPVRTVVDISFLQTIYSPSVTICPGDVYLQVLQKYFAKRNNITDYCKVKTFELLSLPKVSAHFLWTYNQRSVDQIAWTRAKPEYLYEGVCFNTFERKTPINVMDKSHGLSQHEPLCGESYMKVFIKPATGYYDYFLYTYLPIHQKHSISYVIKRIAENSNICVNEAQYEVCKIACFTRKLWQRVNCRLPFMQNSNLTICGSPSSAHNTLQAYLELVAFPQNSADCNCLPPCYKHIYDVIVESENFAHEKGLSYGFGTRHNVRETYRKVPIYPIVSLLCDIGGWLGSTLGFCIFGVVDLLLSKTDKIKFKHLLCR